MLPELLGKTQQFSQLSPGKAAGVCFVFTVMGLGVGAVFWLLPPDSYDRYRKRSRERGMLPGVQAFAEGTPYPKIRRTLRRVAIGFLLIGVVTGVLGLLFLTRTLHP